MLDRFKEHNLHWESKESFIKNDPQIKKYKLLAKKFEFEFLKKFPINKTGIFTLTGGRQLGKSTSLKQLILKALELTTADKIFYLTTDTILDRSELYKICHYFLTNNKEDRNYLFIDEITYIKDWELSIKALADLGLLENTNLLVTGSDKIILEDTITKLPGRRGSEDIKDYQILALNFKEYLSLFKENENLEKHFNNFIKTGGYLIAINEYYEKQEIKKSTYTIYNNWILGDFIRLNKSKKMLLQVILSILKTYGSQVSFQSLTDHTDGVSRDTIKEYCDILERLNVLYIQKAINLNKLTAAHKKDKKFHFTDPFILKALTLLINEELFENINIDESFLVESLIVNHYQKKFPTFYLKATGEIDIAYILDKVVYFIEIKWRNQIRKKDIKQLLKMENTLILSKYDDKDQFINIPSQAIYDNLKNL